MTTTKIGGVAGLALFLLCAANFLDAMDVSTIGGLNLKNFADVIDWWSVMLGELNKFFKEQGAKPTT